MPPSTRSWKGARCPGASCGRPSVRTPPECQAPNCKEERTMTLEELLEIESIKQTRTLGARHLDAGDWDALADLYTSDARCEFGPYGTWEDQSAFARLFREAEDPFVKAGPYSNLHVIVNHVVELAGPDTATGMMYLLDFVTGDMMRAGGNP